MGVRSLTEGVPAVKVVKVRGNEGRTAEGYCVLGGKRRDGGDVLKGRRGFTVWCLLTVGDAR